MRRSNSCVPPQRRKATLSPAGADLHSEILHPAAPSKACRPSPCKSYSVRSLLAASSRPVQRAEVFSRGRSERLCGFQSAGGSQELVLALWSEVQGPRCGLVPPGSWLWPGSGCYEPAWRSWVCLDSHQSLRMKGLCRQSWGFWRCLQESPSGSWQQDGTQINILKAFKLYQADVTHSLFPELDYKNNNESISIRDGKGKIAFSLYKLTIYTLLFKRWRSVRFVYVFEISMLCLSRLNLFDQNYSKNRNIISI